MSWAQFDDGTWSDPALSKLSHRAHRLFANCWIYCADKMTDGRLDLRQIEQVAFMFGLTDRDCIKADIAELVAGGVLTEDAQIPLTEDMGGYTLVDWLEQNRTKQEVLDSRKKTAERQARWRKKGQAKRRGK